MKANDYISKAKEAINKVNQQANTNLKISFKAQKHGDKVQVSGFID